MTSLPPGAGPPTRLSARIGAVQHRVASALGVDEAGRTDTVVAMLANNARRVPGYWIQLFLAMGIATVGLVLDSTAVVIGAMLVSPLMGPIVELGMGFAVGSSLLVIRAAVRVLMSVALVVLGSALLVLALPFHEITSEIATRVAPTALDLLVAVFCALTASYTTVRPGSDTTAAAAGTAVGIALVPPLCTIGFGLGTADLDVAAGSALLFTANLSAIMVIAVLAFLLLGFNRVDAAGVERDFLGGVDGTAANRWADRLHRALGALFGSRYGIAMRVMIPAIFLLAVFVPLRRALDEVTWEVRARDAVRRIVEEESPGAIETAVHVARHTLALRLVLIASSEAVGDLERRIAERVTRATGVTPEISAVAVPDAQRLLALVAAERRGHPANDVLAGGDVRQRLTDALAAEWPGVAGPLLRWDAAVSGSDSTTVVTRHLGAPLAVVGQALLGRALSARLQTPVRVADAALPDTALVAAPGGESQWLAAARSVLERVTAADSLSACVQRPVDAGHLTVVRNGAVEAALRQTAAATAGRLVLSPGERWSLRLVAGACARPSQPLPISPPPAPATP